MNTLFKFGSNLTMNITKTASRSFVVSSRSSKDISFSEEDEIKKIKENEDNYFSNVKQSFDSLKKKRENETLEEKRSRLMYQSRKRGTSENGLLLSNFSAQFLPSMSEKQMLEYDNVINNLHNEWDLYYWLTGAVEMPKEVKAYEIIEIMKKFCINDLKQSRIVQPEIPKMN